MSRDHLDGVETDAAGIRMVGDAIRSKIDEVFALYVMVFGAGALVLYSMLHWSRLVPPLISIWGLVSTIWMLEGTVLAMLDAGQVVNTHCHPGEWHDIGSPENLDQANEAFRTRRQRFLFGQPEPARCA